VSTAGSNASTAFVTGGTGFIGGTLVELLAADGWRVTVLHRPTSDTNRLAKLGVSLAEGSVTDAAAVERAMPEGVDTVFHVAASLSFAAAGDAEQTRTNIGGTRNVVKTALAKHAHRLVHTSSVAAYGLHDGPIIETTRSNASASGINYFVSKALAEAEVRKGIDAGLDAVIINPGNVMGPGDTDAWARLVRLVHAGKVPAVGGGGGSFCHVREVARAHIAASEKGRSGENYLLGGADATYLELMQVTQRIPGGKAPRRAMPPAVMKAAGYLLPLVAKLTGGPADLTPAMARIMSSGVYIDCAKAIAELGYETVPLDEILADTCSWLKQEGLLPD
jgi:nucleoside-diphosphate-sugar epimerase